MVRKGHCDIVTLWNMNNYFISKKLTHFFWSELKIVLNHPFGSDNACFIFSVAYCENGQDKLPSCIYTFCNVPNPVCLHQQAVSPFPLKSGLLFWRFILKRLVHSTPSPGNSLLPHEQAPLTLKPVIPAEDATDQPTCWLTLNA